MFTIKQLTPLTVIRQSIETAIENEMQIIVRKISYIAEKAVNLQRSLGDEYSSLSKEQIEAIRAKKHTPNYIDDTHNLRESIGYMIAVNGEPIVSDLINSSAQKLAQKALSENQNGIALILTAGMEYAASVSERGYDVLDTAELFCKTEFQKMLSK